MLCLNLYSVNWLIGIRASSRFFLIIEMQLPASLSGGFLTAIPGKIIGLQREAQITHCCSIVGGVRSRRFFPSWSWRGRSCCDRPGANRNECGVDRYENFRAIDS